MTFLAVSVWQYYEKADVGWLHATEGLYNVGGLAIFFSFSAVLYHAGFLMFVVRLGFHNGNIISLDCCETVTLCSCGGNFFISDGEINNRLLVRSFLTISTR